MNLRQRFRDWLDEWRKRRAITDAEMLEGAP